MTKILVLIFALAFPLSIVSCGGKQGAPSASRSGEPEILKHLRKPGKITHIRYTSDTPPWPTRTEAWIDWDNNRTRAWNIEWTDSPTNPSVCTSIRTGNDWYLCLPSLDKVDSKDFGFLNALSPSVPLRTSDTRLSLQVPQRTTSTPGAADSTPQPVSLEKNGTTSRQTVGGEDVLVTSWKITSELGVPCEGGQAGPANFEYTTTPEGEPRSEFITVTCGGQTDHYFGILYHQIEFVDRSTLPADFFDVSSARASIIANEMSSAAAQFGSAFWLGDQAGDWALANAEHDAESATLTYSRGQGDQAQEVDLTVRSAGPGVICPSAQPIPNDNYSGSLCTLDGSPPYGGYRIVWNPPGLEVFLEEGSYGAEIGRDGMLALGAKLVPWDKKASGPLLTSEAVSTFVADSLELVCPTKLAEIRKVAPTSSFSFDRKTGEWTGVFGSFGEYAVPDSKPVAIPAKNREEVQSTLSHNGAQFADCTVDEQPPPQPGDDQFGVTFIGKDDSGFTFQVTGVDSKVDAALSMCLSVGGGCGLTAPDGTTVVSHALNLTTIRAHVEKIHAGLDAKTSGQSGEWTFALDLGDGHSARITFTVQ